MPKPRNDALDRATNGAARALLGALAALPYERRVPAAGRAFARVVGPAAGWLRRAEAHIALAIPEMPTARRREIARASLDNAGRAVAEMYAGDAFLARARGAPLTGAGVAALEAAREAGRPIVGVTGHFGNYNAARAALIARGYDMGAVYRRMANPRFDAHYRQAMEGLGGALFAARDRAAMAAMLRHLKDGGFLAILFDLHVHRAPVLRFMGRPARTTLTPAELAARQDALLLPIYALRRPDGLGFELQVGPEVPPGPPADRMQWLNDDLEALVRAHPGQWWWVARRWRDADAVKA